MKLLLLYKNGIRLSILLGGLFKKILILMFFSVIFHLTFSHTIKYFLTPLLLFIFHLSPCMFHTVLQEYPTVVDSKTSTSTCPNPWNL